MREIKCRGLDAHYNIEAGHSQNIFRYGNLIVCDNGDCVIETGRERYGHGGVGSKVIAETVGQYTGLKDKNGKEIYEGDIVQFDDMGEEGYEYKEGYDFTNRAVVTFGEGRFTLDIFIDTNSGVLEEINDHDAMHSTIVTSEVIGNIHENPTLL